MGKCLSCCLDKTNGSNGHNSSGSAGKTISQHSPHDTSQSEVLKCQIEPVVSSGFGHGASGEPNIDIQTHLSTPVYQNGEHTARSFRSLPRHQKGVGYEMSPCRTQDESFETRVNKMFEMYKDPNEDAILPDGVERICADLEIKPDELRILVLAWKFQVNAMCRFSRDEFVNGCKSLKVDSIAGIQQKFVDMLSELKNKEMFRDLYRWSYKLVLDADAGQRTLPIDMAIILWKLVFSEMQSNQTMLTRWLEFLECHRQTVRGITKDTWDMFLNFLESVNEDLSGYDDTEAWPSLFDDFVEWTREQESA